MKRYGDEGRLPPILVECETEDCILEDTVLIALRWQMAGGEAVVLEAIGDFLRKKVGV